MKTYVITNQKGGVGKTATAAALGHSLQARGYRVLFVDLDSQGNLSDCLGADQDGFSSMDILQGKPIGECILHLPQGDLVQASPAIAEADITITAIGKEYRIRDALRGISEAYDYAVIDTPPHLGIATINALTAADGAIIPAEASPHSLKSVCQLSETLSAVKQYCNPGLKIEGILITRHNGRAIINQNFTELLEEAASQLNTKVFDTKIRECITLKEAAAMRQDIFSYAPRSNAAKDYSAFVEELLHDSKQ